MISRQEQLELTLDGLTPALRQQLNAPSAEIPLSLQTTEPPAWLHSEFAPSAEHWPPSGTVFCAEA